MVTAKVKIGRITVFSRNEDESPRTGEVEMIPDYAQGKNSEWSDATPSAVFRMTVSNPSAFKVFADAQERQKGITASFEVDE